MRRASHTAFRCAEPKERPPRRHAGIPDGSTRTAHRRLRIAGTTFQSTASARRGTNGYSSASHGVSGGLATRRSVARASQGIPVNGAGGTVEYCKEPVSRSVDQPATETVELPIRNRVVLIQRLSPPLVSQLCRAGCGTDDICKEDGGKNPFRTTWCTRSRDELCDGIKKKFGITQKKWVIPSWNLHQSRGWDGLRQIARLGDRQERVVFPVDYQSGSLDGGQNLAHVDGCEHPGDRECCARAGRDPLEACPPFFERGVL